jgi:hypothetical protein
MGGVYIARAKGLACQIGGQKPPSRTDLGPETSTTGQNKMAMKVGEQCPEIDRNKSRSTPRAPVWPKHCHEKQEYRHAKIHAYHGTEQNGAESVQSDAQVHVKVTVQVPALTSALPVDSCH